MSDQPHPYKKGQEEDCYLPITHPCGWVSYVMSDQLHPYKKGQEEDNNSSHMGELCDE